MMASRAIRLLGVCLLLPAILMAVAGTICIVFLQAGAGAYMLALASVVGGVSLLSVMATQGMEITDFQAEPFLVLLMFWGIVPLFAAFPFWVLSGDGFGTSWFNSIAALTTTGAAVGEHTELPTLVLWRSFLHWIGGVIAATFAVVVLASVNLGGTGVHRSLLFSIARGNIFDRCLQIGGKIAGVYAFIAFVGFALLIIGDVAVFDALNLALSAVSTAGLGPREGPLATYIGGFAASVLALVCLLGSLNVAILWDMTRARRFTGLGSLFRDAETRAVLSITTICFLAGTAYIGFRHVGTLTLESIFFVSTAGFDYDVIGVDMLPPAFLIAIALIGGSALSTAGGLKVLRLLLLGRHLETDLKRLSHPSRVVPVTLKGRILPDSAFLSVWMYFFAYTLAFGLGAFLFGASGLPFESATASAAASLSNFGPLLGTTFPEIGFSEFSQKQLYLAAGLMTIGRVEVLAFLALMTRQTFR